MKPESLYFGVGGDHDGCYIQFWTKARWDDPGKPPDEPITLEKSLPWPIESAGLDAVWFIPGVPWQEVIEKVTLAGYTHNTDLDMPDVLEEEDDPFGDID